MNHTRTGATIWPTANDLASYADRIGRARALLAEIGTELDR